MSVERNNQLPYKVGDASLNRRGPLRPQQLVSVRKHQDRRMAGHGFRVVDIFLVFASAIYFAYQGTSNSITLSSLPQLLPFITGACATCILLHTLRVYRFGRTRMLHVQLLYVAAAAVTGASITMIYQAWIPIEHVESSGVFIFSAVCFSGLIILHTLWWNLVSRWRSQGLLTPNIVVIGATDDAEKFISASIERKDLSILGVFDDRVDRSPPDLLGVPVLGTLDTMIKHKIMPCVDLIVVTIHPTATSSIKQIMDRLEKLPNLVTMYIDPTNPTQRSTTIDRVADSPLAPLVIESGRQPKVLKKRLQDIVIGLVAVLVFAIPMLFISLAVRIDSKGPIFFRQPRQGFNNERFLVWKFRSMRHETADLKAEKQVTANDQRVTRVGRILRSTSLDELPQLLNVLSGEMSLVGPRPHAIGMKTGNVESTELVAHYAHRHRMKPGMTGWAAINGSRGPLHSTEDILMRVNHDIEYIERQSLWFDLLIMARTIPSLLGDSKAIR